MSIDRQKVLELVLGQGGALVLACVALWYISQLYVDQINGMMVRCDDDRKMYQEHMRMMTDKLDVISADVKDIKETKNAKVD
tara:strand:+ start:3005 stop:3250 length:246 start_codon:yes stop_codon:yes gene_type:complete